MPDFSFLPDATTRFFDALASLYADMDQAYDEIAAVYRFHCDGCAENCCLTRFYHHTLVEFLYLHKGFAGLSENQQKDILNHAKAVNEAVLQAEKAGEASRVMCPLNAGGRCILYSYRPMICRLHGIPHELQHPARGSIRGPGCHEFEVHCKGRDHKVFDRTPFYRRMGKLEQDVREYTGYSLKIKKTVAQMLVTDVETIL